MADFDGMQEFLLNVDWYSVIYYKPSAGQWCGSRQRHRASDVFDIH